MLRGSGLGGRKGGVRSRASCHWNGGIPGPPNKKKGPKDFASQKKQKRGIGRGGQRGTLLKNPSSTFSGLRKERLATTGGNQQGTEDARTKNKIRPRRKNKAKHITAISFADWGNQPRGGGKWKKTHTRMVGSTMDQATHRSVT